MSKRKDLTKIKKISRLDVGDFTWYPRKNLGEGHKRGIVLSKKENELIIKEIYWNFLNDPTIEETIYVIKNKRLVPQKTLIKITNCNNKKEYQKISKELFSQGVVLKKP